MNENTNLSIAVAHHLDAVERCYEEFEKFLKLILDGTASPETLSHLAHAISLAETEADTFLRQVSSFTLQKEESNPYVEQILEISSSCDAIANMCEDFALPVSGNATDIPPEYIKSLISIAHVTHKQFDVFQSLVDNFFEPSTEGSQASGDFSEIDSLETHIDSLEDKLYENIYSMPCGAGKKMQLSTLVVKISRISDIIKKSSDVLKEIEA